MTTNDFKEAPQMMLKKKAKLKAMIQETLSNALALLVNGEEGSELRKDDVIAELRAAVEADKPAKPFKGKVYLHLYHGREKADQEMDDWGFDGPYIKVDCLGFTYETLWIYRNGDREELKIVDSCIEWEGKYYGDFEVISRAAALEVIAKTKGE